MAAWGPPQAGPLVAAAGRHTQARESEQLRPQTLSPSAACPSPAGRTSGGSQDKQNTSVCRIDDGVASSFGAIPLSRQGLQSARPGQPPQNVAACSVRNRSKASASVSSGDARSSSGGGSSGSTAGSSGVFCCETSAAVLASACNLCCCACLGMQPFLAC